MALCVNGVFTPYRAAVDMHLPGALTRLDPHSQSLHSLSHYDTGAAGASFNLNAAAAGQGKVGLVVAQSPGALFSAGTQHVAVLRFAIRREATNNAPVVFSDSPVVREVSDPAANVLSTRYTDGQLA